MYYFIIAFINATALAGTRHIIMLMEGPITMRPQIMAGPGIFNVTNYNFIRSAVMIHSALFLIIMVFGIVSVGWYIALPVSLLVLPVLGSFISYKFDGVNPFFS